SIAITTTTVIKVVFLGLMLERCSMRTSSPPGFPAYRSGRRDAGSRTPQFSGRGLRIEDGKWHRTNGAASTCYPLSSILHPLPPSFMLDPPIIYYGLGAAGIGVVFSIVGSTVTELVAALLPGSFFSTSNSARSFNTGSIPQAVTR